MVLLGFVELEYLKEFITCLPSVSVISVSVIVSFIECVVV